jgi:hypothetical protein
MRAIRSVFLSATTQRCREGRLKLTVSRMAELDMYDLICWPGVPVAGGRKVFATTAEIRGEGGGPVGLLRNRRFVERESRTAGPERLLQLLKRAASGWAGR